MAKRWRLIQADFTGPAGRDIDAGSVDLVFTDPPYAVGSLHVYTDLARFSDRVLKPGGWCFAYCGNLVLPNVLANMASYLTYAWCFCLTHTGEVLRFRKVNVYQEWKPIVAFYKPPLRVWQQPLSDLVNGKREKGVPPWQQGQPEAEYFIAHLTKPGELVCDPCAGSGTTLAAATKLGRRSVGFEIKAATYQDALERLNGGRRGATEEAEVENVEGAGVGVKTSLASILMGHPAQGRTRGREIDLHLPPTLTRRAKVQTAPDHLTPYTIKTSER